jgi:hypothetical protein
MISDWSFYSWESARVAAHTYSNCSHAGGRGFKSEGRMCNWSQIATGYHGVDSELVTICDQFLQMSPELPRKKIGFDFYQEERAGV